MMATYPKNEYTYIPTKYINIFKKVAALLDALI